MEQSQPNAAREFVRATHHFREFIFTTVWIFVRCALATRAGMDSDGAGIDWRGMGDTHARASASQRQFA